MTDSRTIYANDFLERMDAGKANAAKRRSRGLPGKAHGSWTARYSDCAPIERDSHSYAVSVIVAKTRLDSELALEDYLRAAYPERYEAFE